MRYKLKPGAKGQTNLGGSGGMIPWKILKFEVAKDVISCTLGAKQNEKKELFMIIKFNSKLSAVSPFKRFFLHEASQFVSLTSMSNTPVL